MQKHVREIQLCILPPMLFCTPLSPAQMHSGSSSKQESIEEKLPFIRQKANIKRDHRHTYVFRQFIVSYHLYTVFRQQRQLHQFYSNLACLRELPKKLDSTYVCLFEQMSLQFDLLQLRVRERNTTQYNNFHLCRTHITNMNKTTQLPIIVCSRQLTLFQVS